MTLKIIKLVEDPDSTAQDLNKIITHDPALGARILKVVNSAFYGLPGQIGSINRAIVLLGLNAVKNIAIAASLTKLFRGGQICPNFNAKDLWNHSIAVASCTRLLSEKTNLGLPDEAFLAGLIHDLGIMVEIQARRAKFVEAMEKMDADKTMSFRQAEAATLGATHEQFGYRALQGVEVPRVVRVCHRLSPPPTDGIDRQQPHGLTGLVHIADVIAANARIGFAKTVECNQISSELLVKLNLTATQIEEVAKALPMATQEANALLT